MRVEYKLLLGGMVGVFIACGSDPKPSSQISGGDGGSQTGGGAGGSDTSPNGGSAGSFVFQDSDAGCGRTCEQLGWACGYTVDACGNVINCADEGRTCAADEVCTGGLDGQPTQCVPSIGANCEVCDALPDCATAVQPTRITGRVVSPGRDDADTGNQIGVPNAIVYILRDNDESTLPAISSGIPSGGESCDRCEDQDLGPVLVGAVTDATGHFTLEERIPVDREFVLVVKAGKFRRAVKYTLPASAACQTTAIAETLPDNVTRLPRGMSDGLAVNLPRVAVSTGQIDAMECVLEKMGISHAEFSNPGDGSAAPRVHLYRGGPNTGTPPGSGARMDDNTPHASALYTDAARMSSYDMVVADCEGQSWDDDFSERDASGANVLDYVNRGGRLFASHLSFSWLHQNGSTAYDASTPHATGLGPSSSWNTSINLDDTGTGVVSLDRVLASPRIDNFAAWMENEGITTAPDHTFTINEPRSQNTGIGEFSEEFVYRQDGNGRIQQFSFNTPYGAPAEAACGRVSYSGFHVSVGGGTSPFANSTFPNHCSGDLTDQEKVLLYMLFDLGACVGELPLPPPCVPIECGSYCGFKPDGCGNVLDCGPCNPH